MQSSPLLSILDARRLGVWPVEWSQVALATVRKSDVVGWDFAKSRILQREVAADAEIPRVSRVEHGRRSVKFRHHLVLRQGHKVVDIEALLCQLALPVVGYQLVVLLRGN